MSRKTKISALPALPSSIDPSLKPLLGAIKEALEVQVGHRGEQLDKAVTFRDLTESGMAAARFDAVGGGQLLPATNPGDQSTPPVPRSLAANGTFTNVLLSWEGGLNHPLVAATEVFRNTTDNLLTASFIGATSAHIYVDVVEPGTTHYYWVRFRSPSSVLSPFNGTDGTSGTTNVKVSALLASLGDSIGTSHLSTTLSAEIAKIAPLTSLSETAATIETLLGQANSSSSAVTILRDVINNQLSSITVGWSGIDGTSGLQAEITTLLAQATALKATMTTENGLDSDAWAGDGTVAGLAADIDVLLGLASTLKTAVTSQVATDTTTWSGDGTTAGLSAEITTSLGTATNFKSGVVGTVNSKSIEWQGSDGLGGIKAAITTEITAATDLKAGVTTETDNKEIVWEGSDGLGGIKAAISTEITAATDFKAGVTGSVATTNTTWEGSDGLGGIKAAITGEITAATNFKTGVIGVVDTKTTEWQGSDGNGGIKAAITSELSSATNFKTGVTGVVDTKTIVWQGSDGLGGIKAGIATELVDATDFKTGVNTHYTGEQVTWEGADGNGGIKANISTELSSATSLKSGINVETSSKEIVWEGSDGNGGVKAALSQSVTDATSLKSGITSFKDAKELTWEGSDGNGGVKSELTTNLTTATNLKTGIDTFKEAKRLTWESSDGTGGVKANISSNLTAATNLKTGISGEVSTKTTSWEGSNGLGGVKAAITTNLSSASSLKTGIAAEVVSKSATWQGSTGTGGVKAEISSAISTATDFKNGIQTVHDAKYLAWEGNGGSVDGIKNEIIAVETFFTNLSENLMTDMSTFQATWGTGESLTSVLTEHGTKIDDASAEHYVKLDVNNNVTGYGLAATATSSEFAVNAGVFKIVDPDNNKTAPFTVITGDGLVIELDGTQHTDKTKAWQLANHPTGRWFAPATYISSAMIADASIDVAKIHNLTVDMANVTGTLTAAQVSAITVTGSMIEASALITSPTIYGGTITAGTIMTSPVITGGTITGALVLSGSTGKITEAGGSHYGYDLGVVMDITASSTSATTRATGNIKPYNYSSTTPPSPALQSPASNLWRYRRQNVTPSVSGSVAISQVGGLINSNGNTTQTHCNVTIRILERVGGTLLASKGFDIKSYNSGDDETKTLNLTGSSSGFNFALSHQYRTETGSDGYTTYYYHRMVSHTMTFTASPNTTVAFNDAASTGLVAEVVISNIATSYASVGTRIIRIQDTAENEY